jgi:hypothetical protein
MKKQKQYFERITITGGDDEYPDVSDWLRVNGYQLINVHSQPGRPARYKLVAEREIRKPDVIVPQRKY